MKANASTHRSVDYQKISEREQHWRSEVERLLKQAQQTDQQEDQRFGVGQPADPLPDDLASAQKRLQRLQQAKSELEQEAREQLQAIGALPLRKRGRPSKGEQTSQPPKDRKQREKEKKQRLRARKNAAAPGRQYNFVDPDSRVMRDNGQKCFVQAYNVQIAVDAHAQVIVAASNPTSHRSAAAAAACKRLSAAPPRPLQTPSPQMRAIGTRPACRIRH